MDKSKLITGDILSVTSPFVWYKPWRYLSVIIRKVTNSKVNHTSIILLENDMVWVVESDPTSLASLQHAVRKSLWEEWCQDKIIRISRYEASYSIYQLEETIKKEIGKPYDVWSFSFWQILYNLTGIWLGRIGKDAESAWYCSEYVAYVWNKIAGLYPKYWEIVPDDIYKDTRLKILYEGKALDLK